MSVSIIIPTRNQHAFLKQAVESISRTSKHWDFEVEMFVINNQSDEPSSIRYLNSLQEQADSLGFRELSVIDFNEPFNYSKMNNLAAQRSSGEILCFLNNDIEVISDDWLNRLKKAAQTPTAGCIGALLFYPNNTVQHAGVVLGMGTIAGHVFAHLPREETKDHPYFQTPKNCTAVTGACLAVRREVFNEIGGFNENLAVAFNDVDLSLKSVKAGYKNIFLPSVQMYHHESLSRGKGHKLKIEKTRHKKEIQRMQKTWGNAVISDPNWRVTTNKKTVDQNSFVVIKKSRFGLSKQWNYTHQDLVRSSID